jgi:hypothetical protein
VKQTVGLWWQKITKSGDADGENREIVIAENLLEIQTHHSERIYGISLVLSSVFLYSLRDSHIR